RTRAAPRRPRARRGARGGCAGAPPRRRGGPPPQVAGPRPHGHARAQQPAVHQPLRLRVAADQRGAERRAHFRGEELATAQGRTTERDATLARIRGDAVEWEERTMARSRWYPFILVGLLFGFWGLVGVNRLGIQFLF